MGRDGGDLIRWLWERCRLETNGTPGWTALVRTARKSGVSLAALLLAIQGTAGVAGCDSSGSDDGEDTTPPQDTITDSPHGEDILYPIMAMDFFNPQDTVDPPEDTPIAILPPMDVFDAQDVFLQDTPIAIMPPMDVSSDADLVDTIYAILPPMDVSTPDVPLEDTIYPIMPPADVGSPDVSGTECKEDADCPEGMECDLPECPPGMYCILPPVPPTGVCVEKQTPAQDCFTDEECPPGEVCEGASICDPGYMCILPDSPGTCVEPPDECWTDDDCPPGEECVGASVCPPGAFCILADIPGHCEPPPPPEKPGPGADANGSWRGLVEDAVRTFAAADQDDEEPLV